MEAGRWRAPRPRRVRCRGRPRAACAGAGGCAPQPASGQPRRWPTARQSPVGPRRRAGRPRHGDQGTGRHHDEVAVADEAQQRVENGGGEPPRRRGRVAAGQRRRAERGSARPACASRSARSRSTRLLGRGVAAERRPRWSPRSARRARAAPRRPGRTGRGPRRRARPDRRSGAGPVRGRRARRRRRPRLLANGALQRLGAATQAARRPASQLGLAQQVSDLAQFLQRVGGDRILRRSRWRQQQRLGAGPLGPAVDRRRRPARQRRTRRRPGPGRGRERRRRSAGPGSPSWLRCRCRAAIPARRCRDASAARPPAAASSARVSRHSSRVSSRSRGRAGRAGRPSARPRGGDRWPAARGSRAGRRSARPRAGRAGRAGRRSPAPGRRPRRRGAVRGVLGAQFEQGRQPTRPAGVVPSAEARPGSRAHSAAAAGRPAISAASALTCSASASV